MGSRGSRVLLVQGFIVLACGCGAKPAEAPAPVTVKPNDAQHANITTPHGDHSPHHGGLVMMNGEVHYEVVFDQAGRHRIWFSDAVREDLPASIASDVVMVVTPKMGAGETFALRIDDSGESWVADGHPLAGGDMVKVTYKLRGEPFEIEIPVP
jgi:photosystem II stability/assembly factor-like uncharacterized protein